MNRSLGIVLVTVSAVSFGTLAILGRYAYAAGMDTPTVLFLRFSMAAVVMAAWMAARREPLPRGSALIRLVAMGGLGYVGQAFCYFTALKYASAGLVALLLYLYPACVTILSALLLGETVGRGKVLALGLALAGTALTVGPAGGQLPGILLAISAAIIYSVYIIVGSQVMKQVSAVQSSTVIFASAGAVYGLMMAADGPHLPATGTGWAVVAAMVVIATVLPVVAFLAGLVRIGPSNAAMLSTLEPAVTVLLAAWLFGELLSPITLLGGGLILAGVLLLAHGELRRASPVTVSGPSPD